MYKNTNCDVRRLSYHFTNNVDQGAPVGRIKEGSPAEIAPCWRLSAVLCSPSTIKEPLTTAYLVKVQNKELKWSNRDEYKSLTSAVWVITMNSTDLSTSSCTCPPFLKRGQCKHVLGMHIRLKLVIVIPRLQRYRLGISANEDDRRRPVVRSFVIEYYKLQVDICIAVQHFKFLWIICDYWFSLCSLFLSHCATFFTSFKLLLTLENLSSPLL